jgi:hypothetical protein
MRETKVPGSLAALVDVSDHLKPCEWNNIPARAAHANGTVMGGIS